MADSISSSNSLNVTMEYTDIETGKNKNIILKVPNPRKNITETEIKTAMNTFINAQVVKDPCGNPFSTTSVTTASTVVENKITLDVGWNG